MEMYADILSHGHISIQGVLYICIYRGWEGKGEGINSLLFDMFIQYFVMM